MSTTPTSGPPNPGASNPSSIGSSSVSTSSNTATVTTTSSTSTTAASGQVPTTSTTSSSSQSTSQATSTTSSRSDQGAKDSGSATITPSSTSSTPSPSTRPASNNRLPNGAVAGIVVAGAVGLALLTFLATFMIKRRQRRLKSKRRYPSSGDSGGFEMSTPAHRSSATTTKPAKEPVVIEAYGAPGTYEDYLPQSADDRTIQNRTKSILDQIELHIENFYRNSPSSAVRPDSAELAVFDSPYLPASLASLLPRSKNRLNIMKHALAQSVTSSISVGASPARSLLPTEYTLLPNPVTPAKPGYTQILSRWRVMTAYLRPDPTKDAAYIAQRDRHISDTVQSFAKAFAPWKSTGYKDEERARSLSAILEGAASLGLFLFSQPSTMTFHWPAAGEIRSGKIVVSPALWKTTDEKGRDLVEVQIMIDQVVVDA